MSTLVRRAWAQALSALLGVGLMAAPALFGYADTAADAHRIVGPGVASFAFVAMWDHVRPLRRTNLPLAAVLLVAPWVLGSAGVLAVGDGLVADEVDSGIPRRSAVRARSARRVRLRSLTTPTYSTRTT